MPGAFKNRAVEALDELFSGESRDLRETYSTVLELLESHDELAALTRRYVRDDGRWTGPELDHFEGHWLTHDSDLARLMKERYREAVDEAMKGPLPIDTYWVSDATDEFEIHVFPGKRRVAVHVFLPRGFDPLQGK